MEGEREGREEGARDQSRNAVGRLKFWLRLIKTHVPKDTQAEP